MPTWACGFMRGYQIAAVADARTALSFTVHATVTKAVECGMAAGAL